MKGRATLIIDHEEMVACVQDYAKRQFWAFDDKPPRVVSVRMTKGKRFVIEMEAPVVVKVSLGGNPNPPQLFTNAEGAVCPRCGENHLHHHEVR